MDARGTIEERGKGELGWRECGRVKRGGTSNMLGQMHGPTVVCHSCRFRSFQYLFPLNVFSSPRLPPLAIASPFCSRSLYPATSALGAFSFLSMYVSRAYFPREALSIGRFFFPFFLRNYSFHYCMHGYIYSI